MQLLFLEVGEADGEATVAGLESGEDIGLLVSECSESYFACRKVQGGPGRSREVQGGLKRSREV